MITLIIKGTMTQAESAAEMRRIPVTSLHERASDVTVTTPNEYIELVMLWFCEPPRVAPFPVGTCLHYSLNDSKVTR